MQQNGLFFRSLLGFGAIRFPGLVQGFSFFLGDSGEGSGVRGVDK
jgi:hypothetical protein